MERKIKYIDLLKEIPEGLSELEKARWLYLKLGKTMTYDMNVFYLRDELLGKKYNQKVNIRDYESSHLVCKSISEIYIDLLKELGIESELVEVSKDYKFNHVGTKIKFSDGLITFADLTLDLYRIQTGMRTQNFAYTSPGDDYDIISRKELREIDNKLGYTFKGVYLDDFIDFVSGELKNEEKVKRYLLDGKESSSFAQAEIISRKINFLQKHVLPSDLGYVESRNLLLEALGKCLTNEESMYVKQYDLVRNTIDEFNVEFANCIKIDDGNQSIYYIKLPDEEMKQASEDDIEALFENGWKNKQKKKIVNKDEKER